MGPRLELQAVLVDILQSDNVYFQPPPSVSMNYPCIVYNRDKIRAEWANDRPYSKFNRYSVTVIDRDPDSEIPDKIADLRMCQYDRFYTADNLNHTVFTLFF